MRLPREISPNPLLTSTVEIRFQSNIHDLDVLGVFYPVFGKDFPKIKERSVPMELKASQKQFEFAPDFVLSNDDYSFSISRNAVSFENINTYHFWNNYFPVIKNALKKLEQMNVINSVLRVGVRYGSLFENKRSSLDVLKQNLSWKYEGFSEKVLSFQTNFSKGDFNLMLSILPDATLQLGNNLVINEQKETITKKSGFYIDIDSSFAGPELKFGDQLNNVIDQLHLEGKTLFFSLLKEEFVKSLNPQY